MSSLRSYYTNVVDLLIDNAGDNLQAFDYYNDITLQFVPAYWVFVQSLNEDVEDISLDYYQFLLDLIGVPDDDPERSWDFATLKAAFGY